MNYKVTYEIEVDAASPMDAALEVERTLNDMHFRPALFVQSKRMKKAKLIDLELEEPDGATAPMPKRK